AEPGFTLEGVINHAAQHVADSRANRAAEVLTNSRANAASPVALGDVVEGLAVCDCAAGLVCNLANRRSVVRKQLSRFSESVFPHLVADVIHGLSRAAAKVAEDVAAAE